ncbi:MAG: DUF4232 domain-containing protein [Streptosporangiaceae bacterium]
MKPTAVAATFAAAACAAAAGLLAGCASSGPGAHSTVTVTVTASAPPSSPAGTPTSAHSGAPGCATASLQGSLGPGSAAAGSSYYPIVFTNTSGSACTLYGYPGVSFVSASGSQVGVPATEDPVYPRQPVTLPPGGTAHAQLRIAAAQNYPSSSCSPVAVSKLKVYPPGQTSALVIPVTSTGCASTSVPILAVQTVRSGSSG